MQIHTGFGDKDLDLRLFNPLHLRTLLEDKRFSKCRLVLLHASYPFSKEASYLASVYSQVMFSTDGYAFPETFYLGAKRAREVVFSVLHDGCIDGSFGVLCPCWC
ncbi:Protein fluG [Camellia lanceoleosa]|uniref:Protein fluG n=1 Tax=Camellia lanceoleosa TaxID=1840588 RepID=A0ACC0GJD6_9ERIC|nr:Protein fluG [Camellia lanceoleosa]